jgi:hypothetical protein
MMNKELRAVEGIPSISNEVLSFNDTYFTLKQYNGQIINVVIQDGFARACHEDTNTNPLKCQYEKKNSYVIARFSKNGTDYEMFICEADNKVFIYNLQDFNIGDALVAIGIKTMEIPVEKINPFHPHGIGANALDYAFKTIKAMTDINDDDACRLLYRELIKYQSPPSAYRFIMTIFLTSEFTKEVGSKYWIRRKDDFNDNKSAKLIKLPDAGIESTDVFNGMRMSCLCADDEYLLLSSWSGSGAVWLDGDSAFIKINEKKFYYTGEPTVDIPVKSKATLVNATLQKSLQMGKDPVVVIEGTNSISVESFDSCIKCSGEITITGQGSLTLACKSYSAAIGLGGVSQSYGRYVANRSPDTVSKIIVDGIHLEVSTGTPNFSIGTYGLDNDIKIELRNGGTVNGIPEATGKVKRDSVGTTYDGSTKIEGPAVYSIIPFSDGVAEYKINAAPYASPDKKFMS